MRDNTTDKLLITGILMAVLAAAVYTQNQTIIDAFKISLGAAIVALAQRITPTEK